MNGGEKESKLMGVGTALPLDVPLPEYKAMAGLKNFSHVWHTHQLPSTTRRRTQHSTTIPPLSRSTRACTSMLRTRWSFSIVSKQNSSTTNHFWQITSHSYHRTEFEQLRCIWSASIYTHTSQPLLWSLQTRTIRHEHPIPTCVPSFPFPSLHPPTNIPCLTVLECTSVPGPQIRIIINDGVTPLTGIKGCPKQRDGMCPVDTFVKAQKELLLETDWEYDCFADWTVPEGDAWNTTIGSPPKPQA